VSYASRSGPLQSSSSAFHLATHHLLHACDLRKIVAGQSVSKQWNSMNLCQHPTHHLPSSTICLILFI
jgi:hypothetical protein